ncbi:MAG: LuxR C-terminal-related transcriptional regulator [Solirubrobacteraceae bacterium]
MTALSDSGSERPGGAPAERALVELLELERELLELQYVRRADALERAGEAVRRLGEVTAAEGMLARAALELGSSSEFDRVLISEVDGGELRPLALWSRETAAHPAGPARVQATLERLRREPIGLEYPLLEYEVARDRQARVVDVPRAGARTPRALRQVLGWRAYVVAPLTAGADTIGLLHADIEADGGERQRTLDVVDLEVAGRYADGLSGALQRAVLRHTLALHRAELTSAVQWMGARVERLARHDLAHPRPTDAAGAGVSAGGRRLESLTPRELEVLRLLARGLTNLAIANTLVVREGTIKYHVKNILRKLGATSRADAVSRFVRASAEGSSA